MWSARACSLSPEARPAEGGSTPARSIVRGESQQVKGQALSTRELCLPFCVMAPTLSSLLWCWAGSRGTYSDLRRRRTLNACGNLVCPVHALATVVGVQPLCKLRSGLGKSQNEVGRIRGDSLKIPLRFAGRSFCNSAWQWRGSGAERPKKKLGRAHIV